MGEKSPILRTRDGVCIVITKELVQARIDILEGQKQQLSANLNAIEGALQILRLILLEADKPDAPDTTKDT